MVDNYSFIFFLTETYCKTIDLLWILKTATQRIVEIKLTTGPTVQMQPPVIPIDIAFSKSMVKVSEKKIHIVVVIVCIRNTANMTVTRGRYLILKSDNNPNTNFATNFENEITITNNVVYCSMLKDFIYVPTLV